MKTLKKILAPTDLSDLSRAGIRYALEMADSSGTEVIVYNVVGYSEAVPYYEMEMGYIENLIPSVEEIVNGHREQLARFLAANFADCLAKAKVRQEVVVGTPYEKIVDKAASEKVDMIVMSTHGRTGFVHALIGSVAEKVVRLASCPVLTVRPPREKVGKQAAA